MEGDQSFLDLLNFGGSEQQPKSLVGEQETPPTQEPSASVKEKSIKGKNWSSEEDKVLIQAWANTSLDAVIGTDQHAQFIGVGFPSTTARTRNRIGRSVMPMHSVIVTPLFIGILLSSMDACSRLSIEIKAG